MAENNVSCPSPIKSSLIKGNKLNFNPLAVITSANKARSVIFLFSIFHFLSLSSFLQTFSFFPYSSVWRNIIDYQFRIGANDFPSKVPSTAPEMFSECLKAIGSISDINQQPSIDKFSYTLINSGNTAALRDTASSVSNQYSGSFYIGIDLENYANAPKDQIFTGYNTNTEDIYAMINFGTQTGGNNVRFDAYANFDCVVICENQTAYVRF
jgi:hypothetical protein